MFRTLLARLFFLLALAMMLSALAWAGIFAYSERGPRTRHFAQLLTSVANLTRAALVASHPAQRHELLNELSRQEGIRLYVAEEGEPMSSRPLDPFLAQVQEQLQENLGPRTRLLMEHQGERAIFLRIPIEGDDYWIALPRERFARSHASQWIGWGLLAASIALLAAGAFVSRLTRPLRDIAGAAREIGAGHHPPPLAESGPEELTAVARAFNQMNADLARLSQDRTLVLAGISHDLRTPLTRLRLGLELAMQDGELRDGMGADIEEMDRTIGQFLDFARTDGDETAVATDLPGLLAELAAQYARRGIAIETHLSDLPPLPLRPQGLRRAIVNLIDNALRHGGANHPVELVLLTPQPDEFVIEVRDRGPGIPPTEAERLKRPFARLETARSNTGGAGLGLAIVERIVLQHGGSLELLPREEGGLTARVRMPRP
ncbi:ATP-binding protein [Denitratisoma oestradiolicum]|uniref:histidine kinase n=1 Tax=Denitratisoma oestradiolicum TaxID=311182 RepID=A0A6S6XUN5_9PROT|nr:ATP-binding protein [Denitratisoma oestradiolicum]TWO81367.1 hypothetical protein CBW56_04440 [Denitratisoma oestradiolicum]CAB1368560.1 conserved exported protein of unknown function [Denitratisoma oestradiolicum]